ncbi:beta-lactamase family protein [Antrihabitans sp. YC3-6]|uniref:Beta-lactamase family protein n=1 Tax=Antrihabitans stalagmiti TaxID=2799499 RepID=A0A934NNN8_9NOCA|nr:serine hydrolase domain-containing protein [Antrihabitans stalagmiti]MBJ8338593.1 beta-lactamase family protein [Antrihabitans stalagmiti]
MGDTTSAYTSAHVVHSDVSLDDLTRETLNYLAGAQFIRSGLPGLGISVTIANQTWSKAFGFADIATKSPFRLDDHFRIASLTKTFTATAILRLVDRGQLHLDDVLDQFVPGIPNGSRITVRNLLSMTSGVFDYPSDPEARAAFELDPAMPWTPAESVEIMRRHPPDFEPGTRTVYCHSNFALLGVILEAVTGLPAADVINTEVVANVPGLSRTNFPTEQTVPAPHPVGYAPDPDPARPLRVVDNVNPAVVWTAGAMTSTIDDLIAWSRELTTSTLLSCELQQERLRSNRFHGHSMNLGYGLGIMTLNDLVGHNGALVGGSSAMFRLPLHDTTFIVVSNSSDNFRSATMAIALHLVRALFPGQIG